MLLQNSQLFAQSHAKIASDMVWQEVMEQLSRLTSQIYPCLSHIIVSYNSIATAA